ncbi:MAG: hypothetical protein U9Q15_05120 [Patescibacteria group bacterium]|nr:hypothetical protein [Patescibacteria group bacterium]
MVIYKKLLLLFLTSIISLTALILVIQKMSPFTGNPEVSVTMFYLTLFGSCVGILSIIIYIFKTIFQYRQNYYQELQNAIRQGSLLSLMVIITLYIQHIGIISFWTVIILIPLFLLIELYFIRQEDE